MANAIIEQAELETEEIEGPHFEGARLVRAALKSMSLRAASEKMKGLGYPSSHSTINNLKKGLSVESSSVINFAHAFRMDADKLLKAFGHTTVERYGNQKNDETSDSSEFSQIEYFVYTDELTPEGYDDFDGTPQERQMVKRVATEAAKNAYKTITQALREARRESPGTVPGSVPRDDDE